MSQSTPQSFSQRNKGLFAVIRRRFLLVVACTLIVGASAALTAGNGSERYRADGYFVVPAYGQQQAGQPDNAYDAQRLARTYAVLLKRDEAFIRSIADLAALTQRDVRDNLQIVTEIDSAVLRVTWSSDNADEVPKFFAAFAQAVSANPAPTPSLVPNTLQAVNLPSSAVEESSLSTLALPLGLIVGLALGIAASIVLERSFPRLDTVRDISTATALPTVDLTHLSRDGLIAMKTDWQERSQKHDARVVVTGLSRSSDWAVPFVVDSFKVVSGGPGTEPTVTGAGAVGVGGEAERQAQSGDLVVMAVPLGASLDDIRDGIAALAQFDRRPAWIFAVPRTRRSTNKSGAK